MYRITNHFLEITTKLYVLNMVIFMKSNPLKYE